MTRLTSSFRSFDKTTAKHKAMLSGTLGILVNGVETVEVPGRTGFVYVRLLDNLSELIQAYNGIVSPIYGLPVQVVRRNSRYEITGRDTGRYQDWGTTPYLPIHGNQHSFNKDGAGGGDPVWVYEQQFMPLLVMPSGTSGGPNVIVNSHLYNWNGDWKYFGAIGTADLTPYKPTGTTARLVLVTVDGANSVPYLIPGDSYFDASLTGTADIYPHLPSYNSDNYLPVGFVRLVSGTSAIGWDNIYDARQFYLGGGGSATGTVTEFTELADVPSSYAGSASKTVKVNSGATGLEFVEETYPTGTVTEFTELTDAPSTYAGGAAKLVRVNAGETGLEFVVDAPSISHINVYEDDTFMVSGTAISFNGDLLDVSVTGTTAYIEANQWTLEIERVYIDQLGGSGTAGSFGTLYGSLTGTVFCISHMPYRSGSLILYQNGQELAQGAENDWTETSPPSGTFTLEVAPQVDDILTATYVRSEIVTGTVIGGGAGTAGTDFLVVQVFS